MLLQHAAEAASGAAQGGAHPLIGTVAEWIWLVPVLPLLGFLINGLLALTSAYHGGPADPQAHPHDAHATHEGAHAHDHSGGGGHGDDHHPVARHRQTVNLENVNLLKG